MTDWPATVYSGSGAGEKSETLAVEEPLEVRLHTPSGPVTLGILMRTPGADAELVRGWLLAEGLWLGTPQLEPDPENPNVMGLHTPEHERLAAGARLGVSSSACGVCGTGSIERLAVRAALPVWTGGPLSAAFLAGLPGRLQTLQPGFAASGGLHAAGLFGPDGACLCAYEDIGRHNATDKVIGWALERGLLPLSYQIAMIRENHPSGASGKKDGLAAFAEHPVPLRMFGNQSKSVSDSILVVSSRAGFEIVQKAVMGGVAVVVTVGAATSLAAETASTFGLTLCGWARADRLTVYSGAERVRP
ncbi:formate dehydrogenase [Deinococcus puniceus]|uniref:Sulfur carrier protein FdhD n=1 Tax=Deinococcus puniceus TaxID=1182568 RepID=A0A172TCY3_9DEIO|nr:formate dehydrogenase [Deinococcus puniceus]